MCNYVSSEIILYPSSYDTVLLELSYMEPLPPFPFQNLVQKYYKAEGKVRFYVLKPKDGSAAALRALLSCSVPCRIPLNALNPI